MRELWSVDDLVGLALDELGTDERVEVDLADDLPPVLTDASQIQRTLVNILENALRYSPAASPVRVVGEHVAMDVVLRVSDRAPGIESAELERIFEPFQRGTAANGRTGSGLGLAIARGFAETNGARLWAESDGTATVFAVAIPTAPA